MPQSRIELELTTFQIAVLPLHYRGLLVVEQLAGFEPARDEWHSPMLTIEHQSCVSIHRDYFLALLSSAPRALPEPYFMFGP